MTETKRNEILDKNQKIINMVIEKARRDFPDDIAMIGLTGSFSTGDYHEKSDLDFIIINNTPRGWEIADCFILDDVGYDIYCTPWEPRIEAQSKLESPMVSCLVDLQILYCAKAEYMDKFNAYRQRALDLLAEPIGKNCLERAKKSLAIAKQHYADAVLSEDLGTVRYASSSVVTHLLNALTSMNNTYIQRGMKRYLEEISQYEYLPDKFAELYQNVLEADSIQDIRKASGAFLKGTLALFNRLYDNFVSKPVPTYDNLKGTYEELWCNCRNKILASTTMNNMSYAFHAASDAQTFLDEMTSMFGTRKFDLMKFYHPHDLPGLQSAFLQVMEEYLAEYQAVGRPVQRFKTFDDLYTSFMSK